MRLRWSAHSFIGGVIRGLLLMAVGTYVQAAPIRIMPLGDSITYDDRSGDTRPPELRSAYRNYLWYLLVDSGYDIDFVGSVEAGQNILPLFDPDNEGYPGWRASQIAANVYTFLANHPADIIMLHIGTNGLTSNPSGVEAILDEVDRFETDTGQPITVILALIINRSCITASPPCAESALTTTFNDAVDAMAQARFASGDDIVVVDMELDAGLDYRLAPLGDMYDNLHPSDSGYAKMADVWFDALQSVLPLPSEPLPFVDILSPASGAVVTLPFNVEFNYGNWNLTPEGTHLRLIIDGVDRGPYFSPSPITVSQLGPGSHLLKLVLANPDGSLTNYFDGISITNNLA
ncbi:MAG: GDSL-type esterase/lipase family protein, partial [Desulfosarcinaceae bacterium]